MCINNFRAVLSRHLSNVKKTKFKRRKDLFYIKVILKSSSTIDVENCVHILGSSKHEVKTKTN